MWVHEDPIIVNLTIDGEVIETTPNHPFYTANGEWIEAGDLQIGAKIRQADGSYGLVESVVFVERTQWMYNLTVAEAHTYFVGVGRWLVHNECGVNFDDFAPSSQTAFSGVYDPATGKLLIRPSGDTVLASGEVPANIVSQYGGHATVNRELAQANADVNSSQTVGFTLFYDAQNQLSVAWNSGSVNLRNHGGRAAPFQFRQDIMDAIGGSTGFNVRSR